MPDLCFCGCGKKAAHDHHVVYVQELRRQSNAQALKLRPLTSDRRNIVRVAFDCHHAHHTSPRAQARYLLERLPDSVFEFAGELLGGGRAYEYLRRRYRGEDPRLDALCPVHLRPPEVSRA